jgi:hypothetical protein
MISLTAVGVTLGADSAAGLYTLMLLLAGLAGLRLLGLGRGSVTDLPLSGYLGLALAFGTGAVGGIWLLLAVLHGLLAPVVAAVGLALLLAGAQTAWRLLPETAVRLRANGAELYAQGWAWWLVAVLLALLILEYGLAALHPAIGDAVAFYLPWARVMAASGQVMALPGYDQFSAIWTLAEIHVAATMTLAGDWPARPLPFFQLLGAALLLWGIGRSLGLCIRGRLIALVMLFCTSNVGLLVWDGKTDLFALPQGLGAIYAGFLMRGPQRYRMAALAGALTTFAVAGKVSHSIILAAPMLMLVLWRSREGAWQISLARAVWLSLVLGLTAVIAAVPQVLKNLELFGEPLAPFVYFGSAQMDVDQIYYSAAVTRRLLLSYPLALVFGNYWAQYGTVTVLTLAFLPLACLRWRGWPRRGVWVLTAAALAGLASWMFLRPSTFAPRYFLPVLVLLFLVLADGAARASLAARWPIRALILVALGFILLHTELYLDPTFGGPMLAPVVDTWRYASAGDLEVLPRDDVFSMAKRFNAELPAGARLALVGYYRYPLRADLLECLFSQKRLEELITLGPTRVEAAWRDGADYFVVDASTFPYARPDFDALPSWLRLEPVIQGDRIQAWRLRATAEAPRRQWACTRDGRAWRVQPDRIQ